MFINVSEIILNLCTHADIFVFFRPKLKEHMQYCVDHPEEMNKLAKVQAQISEVKGVMMENIEKVSFLIYQRLVVVMV